MRAGLQEVDCTASSASHDLLFGSEGDVKEAVGSV